jgi:hypothetical protein
MKEFSPVIRTAFGSTGGIVVVSFLEGESHTCYVRADRH